MLSRVSRRLSWTSNSGPSLRQEAGASLVEFALVMPLLIVLVLGVVEFGWLFTQHLNVRHGAREGARLIAVNYNPNSQTNPVDQTNDIVTDVCGRMDVVLSTASVDLTGAAGGVGGSATTTVSSPGQTITGLLDWAIPPGLTLSSTVETRLEQLPTWTDTVGPQACP